jgi:ribosomal-protein-alanine N-acetyltransferase
MLKIPARIETHRLAIRPFEVKDYPAFHSFMKHPDATRFLLFSADQKTEAGILNLFEQTIASYKSSEPIFSLTIADRKTDEFIGSAGMAPDYEGTGIQMYWAISPGLWGKGLASEAARALIRYGFETLGMESIRAYMHPNNLASIRVAEKAGMCLHNTIRLDDFDQDALCYQITNKEQKS